MWRSASDGLANPRTSSQPWSTYAVHLTTLSHWAILWDALLVYSYFRLAESWDDDTRAFGLALLTGWMLMSKFLKLLGHYIRYPVDFLLLPVSILFGYFHGLIKGYAMLSLNVVSFDAPSLAAQPQHDPIGQGVHRCSR